MMIFGTRIDEDTGKPVESYLTFDSGKKVILTSEEGKEVEAKLRVVEYGGRLLEQEDMRRNK